MFDKNPFRTKNDPLLEAITNVLEHKDPYIQKKGSSFNVINNKGKAAKSFTNMRDAEMFLMKNIDALTESVDEEAIVELDEDIDVSAGSWVEHDVMGVGRILESKEETCAVMFENSIEIVETNNLYFVSEGCKYKKKSKKTESNKKDKVEIDPEEKIISEARPKKEDSEEADTHIIMQLRKAVSMNGNKEVFFKNGEKQKISAGVARKALDKFEIAKTSDAKQKIMAACYASVDSLNKVAKGK